jgi:hypothetical protein
MHRSAQINLRVFAFSRTVLLCLHLAASDVRFGVDFYRPHRAGTGPRLCKNVWADRRVGQLWGRRVFAVDDF